jgi:hypothetical protein
MRSCSELRQVMALLRFSCSLHVSTPEDSVE